MKTKKTCRVPYLKESLTYGIGVLEYIEDLEDSNKDVFAKKLYRLTMLMNYNMQMAYFSAKDSEHRSLIKKATKNIEDSLYWIKQCSTYVQNTSLMEEGQVLFNKHKEFLSADK